MLLQQDIIDFCNKHNYDIRQSRNARWIDQKCAADVVTIIADCIYNFIENTTDREFTTKDIWHSLYAIDNVENIFKKPDITSDLARNEYDKFFQQPMELLAYAKVLSKNKLGNRNIYRVNNLGILEYIALREKNALFFLKNYIEKVLTDSGLMALFNSFFITQTKASFQAVKKGFSIFIIQYTNIKGTTECNRIFIKVINPLAYYKDAYGTERGRISSHKITYDMLMYNRNNFRDIYANKPKGTTRKEFSITKPMKINLAYYKYQSTKAKRFLRCFNDQFRMSKTEHLDDDHVKEVATHVHHIFPESEYPDISYYLENLIVLTPTQHLNHAHPLGRTQEINEQFQHLLLLSKADRIQENYTDEQVEVIYDFSKFIHVLNVGFDDDSIIEIPNMHFSAVVHAINMHYA